MKWLFLFLLMTSFVSAVDIDFSCPDEVRIEEEFACTLNIIEGDGFYDVKVDIENDGKSVARIWDTEDNDWKSAFYYVNNFIGAGEEEDIDLIITAEGEYDAVLKLRQDDTVETFSFSISALDDVITEKDEESTERRVLFKPKVDDASLGQEQPSPRPITLNEPLPEIPKETLSIEKKRTIPLSSYIGETVLVFLLIFIGYYLWQKI